MYLARPSADMHYYDAICVIIIVGGYMGVNDPRRRYAAARSFKPPLAGPAHEEFRHLKFSRVPQWKIPVTAETLNGPFVKMLQSTVRSFT